MKPQLIVPFVLLSLQLTAQDLYPTFQYRKASDSVAWNSAWAKYESGKYKEAIRILDKLPRFYRSDAAANRLKALCYFELKENPAALYWLGHAMIDAPDHYGLLCDRAEIWNAEKNYRAQAADLSAYLHFVRDDTAAVYNYVYAVSEIDEKEKAIAVLEEFAFKDAGLHGLLNKLYLDLGMCYTAIPAINAALQEFPDDESLWSTLAVAYYCVSKFDLSLETAERLIALNPENGYSYALRGWIYKKMNRMFDARVSFELAEYYGYSMEDDDEGDYEDED